MVRAGLVLLAIAAALLAFFVVLDAERQRTSLLVGDNAVLQRQVDALAKAAKWSEGQLRAAQERLAVGRAELASVTVSAASATRRSEQQAGFLAVAENELAELRLARDRAVAERALMARELEQTQLSSQRATDTSAAAAARLADELVETRSLLGAARDALAAADTRESQHRQRLERQSAEHAAAVASLREAQAAAETRQGAEHAAVAASLRAAQATLDTQRGELARAGSEVQRALTEASASRAEVERLELTLATVEKQRDRAAARQRELRAWIDTQAAAVAVVEERLASAEDARLAAEQSLVARDSKLLERVTVLDKGLAGATRSLVALDAENTAMAIELADMRQQLEDSAVFEAELETALEAARDQGIDLRQRLDEAQAELAATVAERDRLEVLLERLAADAGGLE